MKNSGDETLVSEKLGAENPGLSDGREPVFCRVVVPGLPRPLLYATESNSAEVPGIGSEVLIEVGSKERRGWVIETLSEEAAGEILRREKGDAPQPPRSRQVSLFERAVARKLVSPALTHSVKVIREHRQVFHAADLQLFDWVSSYYGYALADVIETAIPAVRTKTLAPPKQRRRGAPHALSEHSSGERVLTAGQREALGRIEQSISEATFSTFLLFGVTGSGKTEVYLSAVERVLSAGKTALIVVPEIALTPQLIDQFASRLQMPIGLLHSQVGPGERRRTWEQIVKGEVLVALGARSAVFAPLSNLGLIVVDEEHEASYKQSDGLRYHARDVAVMRARFAGCTAVLGSATPSFESLVNVQRKRYHLLEMPERVTTRPLPAIEIVDLSKIKRREMPSPNVSPQLRDALTETLTEGGQAIIFYNRRGFSTYLQCDTCSEVVMCPHCSLPLTFHKVRNRLLCHYCDFTMLAPQFCAFCRDPSLTRLAEGEKDPFDTDVGHLSHWGGGTERVVEEIGELFPQARIVRMDRDTVKKKDSYRSILGAMRSGAANILVGTQMIAKGHDLPGVTLVGIVSADVGLHLPDFRSSEKTFQLITQAAGRAGRGERQGRVIVQTRQPNHPTIVATASGRFKAFARYELEFRKRLNYPPFGRLMRIVVSSTRQPSLEKAMASVHDVLQHILRDAVTELELSGKEKPIIEILGPAVAPHEKLRARFRMHILVKASSAKLLSAVAHGLRRWRTQQTSGPEFRVTVDIDPVDML